MLIPSIDLQDGAVVQLVQGERLAVRDDDVFRWVARFERFPKVQVIDLDAAMGKGDNLSVVRRIVTALNCRVGGGVRTVERARTHVEARRDVEPEDASGLHELRIAYKELRYSIELLSDALPIDARALLEPATVFQKRLGELLDVDVAIQTVRDSDVLAGTVRDEALASLGALRSKRLAKYLREVDPLGHNAPSPTEPRALNPPPTR
jgi:uncharacterized protein related to proFAR isomerase